MSRSSDPVDPLLLLPFSLLPTASDIDELSAIDLHLRSSMASRIGLKDVTNSILSGNSVLKASDYSPVFKRLSEVAVSVNAVENYRERRPDLRQKRPRFSMKPSLSEPNVSLESTFDSKKYKNPEDYFRFYERNENAKRELEKQMGGAVLDGDKQNPSPIARVRRPGIPRRSIKYKHIFSALENDIMEDDISTQETFETSIHRPLSQSSQTECHENVDSEGMELASKTISEDKNKNILDGLLSQPTEELEGDGALRRLKESFNVKSFELEDLCLPEFPDIQMADLKFPRRTLPNPRPVKPKQGGERTIRLASPTTPKSLLASLSLMTKRSSSSFPSDDPFSHFDIDQSPVTNPSSVENRKKQSDLIDITEEKINSDDLTSPLIEQNDKVERGKTGSREVSDNEFTNASKRSKRDILSKCGVAYDVDAEEEGGGNKVTSETFGMPEDDTNYTITRENGLDNYDKVAEKMQEAGPEVTAEDSTFNGVQSQVADVVIERNDMPADDRVPEPMPEHNLADSTSVKLNRAPVVDDIVMNHYTVKDQDKLQDSVACAERGFDVAESTAENLSVPSQSEQLNSSPVEEHPRDLLSEHLDVGLEKQTEIMQEHSGVPLEKPSKANTRSKAVQKKKKASKRQSLACHGTAWESGVRRSTRIRTRPLEYWKGERLLIGRIHNSLPTVIGMKYASPGKGEGSLKVKSFVEDKHKVLVDLVSYH